MEIITEVKCKGVKYATRLLGLLLALCSSCVLGLCFSNNTYAGSYAGAGSQYRVIYNNFATTSSAGVGNYIESPIASPWVLGVEYVFAIEAGSGSNKISGHAIMPINGSNGTGAGAGTWYGRLTCNNSTVKIGIGTAFWTYNATNVKITNCEQRHTTAATNYSAAFLYAVEFDFEADIPTVSGGTNVSIKLAANDENSLIWQGSNPVVFYAKPPSWISGNTGPYTSNFVVAVGADETALLLQQQIAAINNQTQQQNTNSQAQINATNQNTQAINNMNQQNQENREDDKNAANEAINAENGDPDTEAAQNTTKGFYDIFDAIFGAATSGTCTLPEISAYGFNIGNIDLCTFTPPAWLKGALGAVATIAAAWCGIQLIRRVVDVAIGGISR